jgi:hypothetical protein
MARRWPYGPADGPQRGRRIREDFRLRRSAKKLRGREISWEDADLIDSGAPK